MTNTNEFERRRATFFRILKERGVNLLDLAQRTGVSASVLNAFRSGNIDSMSDPHQEVIARALSITVDKLFDDIGTQPVEPCQLPVVGLLQAGMWMEDGEPENFETIPAVPDSRYPERHQYALKTQGRSMNLLIPHGDYAHCVDWAAAHRRPEQDMIVVVRRSRQGLTETTLKQVDIDRDGNVNLLSRSDDERYRVPISIGDGPIIDGDCDVTIQAVVLGRYQPFY